MGGRSASLVERCFEDGRPSSARTVRRPNCNPLDAGRPGRLVPSGRFPFPKPQARRANQLSTAGGEARTNSLSQSRTILVTSSTFAAIRDSLSLRFTSSVLTTRALSPSGDPPSNHARTTRTPVRAFCAPIGTDSSGRRHRIINPRLQTGSERDHLRGGFNPELLSQDLAKTLILPPCVESITFRDKRFDQAPVRAFS